MGIGREPEFRPMLEDRDALIFAWGGTVRMIVTPPASRSTR